jgi:hypothetical protein
MHSGVVWLLALGARDAWAVNIPAAIVKNAMPRIGNSPSASGPLSLAKVISE